MSEQVTDAGKRTAKVYVFLAAIRVCPNITRAAKAAKISASLHHRRYKTNELYAKVFDAAWAEGVQAMEDLATDRAMFGWQEPVVYQGQISLEPDPTKPLQLNPETGEMEPVMRPVTITKIDNGHLQFMLRGAKPEKYRERHTVTGKDGGPIEGKIEIVFVTPTHAAQS